MDEDLEKITLSQGCRDASGTAAEDGHSGGAMLVHSARFHQEVMLVTLSSEDAMLIVPELAVGISSRGRLWHVWIYSTTLRWVSYLFPSKHYSQIDRLWNLSHEHAHSKNRWDMLSFPQVEGAFLFRQVLVDEAPLSFVITFTTLTRPPGCFTKVRVS